jgi:hypothetical protein
MNTNCLLCSAPADEEHHLAGKTADPVLTVSLCAPCHRRIHREMEDAGVQLDTQQRTVLGRLEVFLRSLGAFLVDLGERLLAWAHEVARIVRGGAVPTGEGV